MNSNVIQKRFASVKDIIHKSVRVGVESLLSSIGTHARDFDVTVNERIDTHVYN
jgi:hypothetical protein